MDGYAITRNNIPMLHLGVFVDREVADVIVETLAKSSDGEYGLYPVYVHTGP